MNSADATQREGGSAQRTRVKICGITNPADAESAISLGADALGFNAWSGSKRFIDLIRAGDWIRELAPFVARVAVLVNASRAEAESVFDLPFIDCVQFHGNEDAEFCGYFAAQNRPFIKAIALKDTDSPAGLERFATRNILVDSHSEAGFGGTGRLIDLDLAERLATTHRGIRLILSGGLSPDNAAEAIRRVRPFAVDVATGVEAGPGKKDSGKMRAFMEAVRSAQE